MIKYLFPSPKGSRIEGIRKRNEKRFRNIKRPVIPEGVPQDFFDALNFEGMCAVPLFGKEGWTFTVIDHGGKVVDSRTGQMVSFKTYEEAMENIRGYLKKKARKK